MKLPMRLTTRCKLQNRPNEKRSMHQIFAFIFCRWVKISELIDEDIHLDGIQLCCNITYCRVPAISSTMHKFRHHGHNLIIMQLEVALRAQPSSGQRRTYKKMITKNKPSDAKQFHSESDFNQYFIIRISDTKLNFKLTSLT